MISSIVREIGRDIGIGLLVVDHFVRRVVGWEEDIEKAKTLFGRRKGDLTMSLGTIINGITLAEKDALALSAFMTKLPEYLPVIQKQLADLQKAAADRSDPAALIADSSILLADLNTDLNTVVPMITNLLPALKPAA